MSFPVKPLRSAGWVALAAALIAATPGSAAQKPDPADFSYIATINCGKGKVKVGSGDDMWAPLVDLKTGRKYHPVYWSLKVGDRRIRERKPGTKRRASVWCTYADQAATGRVKVLKRS